MNPSPEATTPTTDNATVALQIPNASATAQKPPREQLRQTWNVSAAIQQKLVAYHSAMSRSDAKVTYQDGDNEISRKATPRETLRHMKELHTFGKLTLRQQKIDAGIPDDDDDDKDKTVNDFVTKAVGVAGKQMSQEAKALGLESAAELPMERAIAIYEAAEAQCAAEDRRTRRRGCKPVPACSPEYRNDWIIPPETQTAIMDRLVDMSLPCGREYRKIRPRERLMASKLLGQFCALGQDQQVLELRLKARRTGTDWDAVCAEMEKTEPLVLAERRRVDEEFYKTHERGGRPARSSRQAECRL